MTCDFGHAAPGHSPSYDGVMTKRPDGTKEAAPAKPAPPVGKTPPSVAKPAKRSPTGSKLEVPRPAKATVENAAFVEAKEAKGRGAPPSPLRTNPYGVDVRAARGEGPEKGWNDSTMMVELPLDVGISKLQAELPQDNMEAMQKVLARCEVTHVSPALQGFNFKNFVKNLKGISKVELGDVKLYALLTRNNAFILANLIAEKLHDLVKGLMDLHLGDRIMLKDGDKVRYLYKVPSAQMERLRTIANQNRLVAATGFPFKDLAQLRQKLAQCPTPAGFEEMPAFARRIAAVSSLYQDKDGNGYHLLVLDDGMAWQLYVNPKAAIPGAAGLMHGTTKLALTSA